MLYLFIIAAFLLFVIWASKNGNCGFFMYMIALFIFVFAAVAPIFA